MTENKKAGILKHMEITLKMHFLWPNKNISKLFYWKIFLVTFLTAPVFFGVIGHLVVAIYENNGSRTDVDILAIISLSGMYYFILCYLLNVKDIVEAYWTLSDLTIFGTVDNLAKFNRKMNLYSGILYMFIIFFLGSPFIEPKNCKTLNKDSELNEVCGLINIWVPFGLGFYSMKQIFFLIEIFLFRCTYMTATVIAMFNVQLIEHIVFRFTHVKILLLEAVKEETYDKRRLLFNCAIDYHNFVLSHAEKVSDCFSGSNFLHLIQTGIILGISGYGTVETPQLFSFMVLFGYITVLSFISLAGQNLIDESQSVGETLYINSEWYNLEIDIQKDFIFILRRCQRPVYIKAGPFGYLGFHTLIAVCKTAYSVLTLFQSLD